jgi:hypothetical protein
MRQPPDNRNAGLAPRVGGDSTGLKEHLSDSTDALASQGARRTEPLDVEALDDYDEIAELETEGWVIQRDVQNVAIFPNANGDIVIKEIVHAFLRACTTGSSS